MASLDLWVQQDLGVTYAFQYAYGAPNTGCDIGGPAIDGISALIPPCDTLLPGV